MKKGRKGGGRRGRRGEEEGEGRVCVCVCVGGGWGGGGEGERRKFFSSCHLNTQLCYYRSMTEGLCYVMSQ